MSTHTLYRFFDVTGALLYVGITNNPPRRFGQHRSDKDWWSEISSITLESYSSREQLAEAERKAVQEENPKYNKALKRSDVGTPRQPGAGALKIGEFVALGLSDGRCPVGVIVNVDEDWVTLGLREWLAGFYDAERRSYPIDHIVEIVHAYRDSVDGLVDDDHLARFQTYWKKSVGGER